MVLSYAATVVTDRGNLKILIADVKRAYFYAKARRYVYMELPVEDKAGNKDMLGKLKLNLWHPGR